MASAGTEQPRVTPRTLREMKRRADPIVMLTAYDWLLAGLLEGAGVDILLVGDSCGMVVHGHSSTLPMTMEIMLAHAASVARAARRALVVGDMPFLSYQASDDEGLRNAGRFLQEAGADAVKLEGGARVAPLTRRLVEAGIPVMAHLGLTPQSVKATGGYGLQAKDPESRKRLLEEARMLEQAGAFALVLEMVPSELAGEARRSLSIPVIGIGAGPDCDGQVLVTHDMLGLFEEFKPRFVRRYAELAQLVRRAAGEFIGDVKAGRFPGPGESY